jgi:hypothetical protein
VVRAGKLSAVLPDAKIKLGFRGLPVARFLQLCDGVTEYRAIRAKDPLSGAALRGRPKDALAQNMEGSGDET